MSQKRLLLSFSLILPAALQPSRSGSAKGPGHSSQNGRQTPLAKSIDNPKEPLITTNFSLHRYLDGKKPPSARQVKEVCSRYCSLMEFSGRTGRSLLATFATN